LSAFQRPMPFPKSPFQGWFKLVTRALLGRLSGALLCLLAAEAQGATVVLDAGHGGHDPGGIPGQRYVEKHATLRVTKLVQARLKAAGHRVLMTRTSDVFVELSKRVAFSNGSPANAVFVSIHFNSSPNKEAHGIETYYYNKRSLPLAQAIHRQVLRASGEEDRDVRHARFYVLRNNRRTAALAELGFLTNATEGARVAGSKDYCNRLAAAVADGILSVLR
jgi:N-acetylmuramoyl-L-alanine amidase